MICRICHTEYGNGNSCPLCGFSEAPVFPMPPHALGIGYAVLGRYVVSRIISANEFEITYGVYDINEGTASILREYLPAALSVRLPDGTLAPADPGFAPIYDRGLRRYAEKASASAALPNSSFKNAFGAHGSFYALSPYPAGEALSARLATSGAMGEAEAMAMMKDISEELSALHGAGIVHGAVTPENIFIDKNGKAALAPPALWQESAKAIAERGDVALVHGFSAPEEYDPMCAPSAKQDIYALGAVAASALLGMPPQPAYERASYDGFGEAVGQLFIDDSAKNAVLSALSLAPEGRPDASALYAMTTPKAPEPEIEPVIEPEPVIIPEPAEVLMPEIPEEAPTEVLTPEAPTEMLTPDAPTEVLTPEMPVSPPPPPPFYPEDGKKKKVKEPKPKKQKAPKEKRIKEKKSSSKGAVVLLSILLILALLAAAYFALLHYKGEDFFKDLLKGKDKEVSALTPGDNASEGLALAPSSEMRLISKISTQYYETPDDSYNGSLYWHNDILHGETIFNTITTNHKSDDGSATFDGFNESSLYRSELEFIITAGNNATSDLGVSIKGIIQFDDGRSTVPFGYDIIIPREFYSGCTSEIDWKQIFIDSFGEDYLEAARRFDVITYAITFCAFDKKGAPIEDSAGYTDDEALIEMLDYYRDESFANYYVGYELTNHRISTALLKFASLNDSFTKARTLFISATKAAQPDTVTRASEIVSRIASNYTDCYDDIAEYLVLSGLVDENISEMVDAIRTIYPEFSLSNIKTPLAQTSLDIYFLTEYQNASNYRWIDSSYKFLEGIPHFAFNKAISEYTVYDELNAVKLMLQTGDYGLLGGRVYTLSYSDFTIYAEGYEPLSIPDGSVVIRSGAQNTVDISSALRAFLGENGSMRDYMNSVTAYSIRLDLASEDAGETAAIMNCQFRFGYDKNDYGSMIERTVYSAPVAVGEAFSCTFTDLGGIDPQLITWDSTYGFLLEIGEDVGLDPSKQYNIAYRLELKGDDADSNLNISTENTSSPSGHRAVFIDLVNKSLNKDSLETLIARISNAKEIKITLTITEAG